MALGFGRSGALARGRRDVGSGLGSREVLVGCSAAGDVSRMWAGCQMSCLTTFEAARCMKKPIRPLIASVSLMDVNIERMIVNIERMDRASSGRK